MKPHYEAWLASHPDRTMAWLCERVADGFDIHHIDGDHGNNDPDNLLLVESADHMRIHGMDIRGRAREATRQKAAERLKVRLQKGETAYSLRASGHSWKEVAIEVYSQNHTNPEERSAQAINVAKAYATYHGLAWPIEVDQQAIRERLKGQRMLDRYGPPDAEHPTRLVKTDDEYRETVERAKGAGILTASSPCKVFNYREAYAQAKERGR